MLGKLVNTLVQTAKAKSTKVEDFLTGSKESVKKEQEIDALCISSDLNSDSFFEVFDAQYKSIMAKYSGEYSREYEVGAIVGNLQQLVRKSKEIAVAMRNVDHRKKYDSVVMHLSRKIKRYESKETLQAYLTGRSIKTLIYLVEYRHDPNCVSDQEFADGEALLERIVKIKDVRLV